MNDANAWIKAKIAILFENGEYADNSHEAKEPVKYYLGYEALPSALEKALTGVVPGETREVTLDAANAFGVYEPANVKGIDVELIPPHYRRVGFILGLTNEEGELERIIIRELKEKTVVVDYNHPLAGEKLTFRVQVTEVYHGT